MIKLKWGRDDFAQWGLFTIGVQQATWLCKCKEKHWAFWMRFRVGWFGWFRLRRGGFWNPQKEHSGYKYHTRAEAQQAAEDALNKFIEELDKARSEATDES